MRKPRPFRVPDNDDPFDLLKAAHLHWYNIGWPEDKTPVEWLERALELLGKPVTVGRRDMPRTPLPGAVIPLCVDCDHKATDHAVDDEELRECMTWRCRCEQFVIPGRGR